MAGLRLPSIRTAPAIAVGPQCWGRFFKPLASSHYCLSFSKDCHFSGNGLTATAGERLQ